MCMPKEFNSKNCIINFSMNFWYKFDRKYTEAWDLSFILKLNSDWNVVVSYLCSRLFYDYEHWVAENLSIWVSSFLIRCWYIFSNYLLGVLMTYYYAWRFKNACLLDKLDGILKFNWPLSRIITGRACCLWIYL
jgi:hypothetical protein